MSVYLLSYVIHFVYTSHKQLSRILLLYTVKVRIWSKTFETGRTLFFFLLLRLLFQAGSMVKED